MRRIDWIWAAALLLKGIGASWDVAWHFRTLRETISPPHMVNTLGGVLVAYALWWEWKHRSAKTSGPFLVVLSGMALFLFAIPFDTLWHELFGLDLTTWSVAHLMLFYGTTIAAFGVLLLVRTRETKTWESRILLAIFVIFFAGAMYFPMTYNEYTTVAAITVQTAPETMDPAIVEFARSVDDMVFHGTPRWLYPVYAIGIAAFLGTLMRAWIGRGWALIALGGIAAERVVANAIVTGFGLPGAALPLQFLFMGIAIEIVWLARAPALVSTIGGSLLAAGAGYAYFEYPITWAPAVPIGAESWAIGLPVAVASGLLALVLARKGLKIIREVPEIDVDEVRAWIRARLA